MSNNRDQNGSRKNSSRNVRRQSSIADGLNAMAVARVEATSRVWLMVLVGLILCGVGVVRSGSIAALLIVAGGIATLGIWAFASYLMGMREVSANDQPEEIEAAAGENDASSGEAAARLKDFDERLANLEIISRWERTRATRNASEGDADAEQKVLSPESLSTLTSP